ncbi:MAG: multicopper oxidase domain-containing protein [Spirochaetales bacterium]|nr:multicopper oxidase domain-containing protein [Spirochaetales bacterium]
MKKIYYINIFFLIINIAAASGSDDIFTSGKLSVPPLIGKSELYLAMQKGTLSLSAGNSRTMGFNGNYLGPTIQVSKGDYVKFNIENKLGEESTVHWHGLHVPAEFDGGPHQVIRPGEIWKPEFVINQNAATLWYHPHLMGKTAEHVYKGLAGMFIIEDDYSKSLKIPQRYGINDFPVILQDRRLDRNGAFEYLPRMPDIMHGYTGNIMLANGAYKSSLELGRGTYRFRLLNGSNSSLFRISFSDSRMFTVIASDGGFLPESVKTDSLVMSPGERYEILIDFMEKEEISLVTEIAGGDIHEAVKIKINGTENEYFTHPETFKYQPVVPDSGQVRRTFRMENRGMGNFMINGKKMSLKRIDFSLKKNSSEIWTIENAGMGMMMNIPHSFHVHDVQFSVISINGRKPGPLYSGPKDTVLVMPGDRVEIALKFQDYTGIYMYHCHFLEHEDEGMMGQFEVLER